MFKVLLFIACVVYANAQYYLPQGEGVGVPNPYQFSYNSPTGETGTASSSHQEQGDGQGRVTGSYSIVDEDGRQRIVEYVADENGFRANVRTNELGTSNMAPADVTISSSADEGNEALTFGYPGY